MLTVSGVRKLRSSGVPMFSYRRQVRPVPPRSSIAQPASVKVDSVFSALQDLPPLIESMVPPLLPTVFRPTFRGLPPMSVAKKLATMLPLELEPTRPPTAPVPETLPVA